MATKEQLAALAETQSELSAPSGTVGAPSGLRKPTSLNQLSGEMVQLPSGDSVPIEFYDWLRGDQRIFLEAKEAIRKEAANESLALQAVNQFSQQQVSDAQRITRLEKLTEGLVRENGEFRQQLAGTNTTIQIGKSNELIEQESNLAQLSIKLQAVGAAEQAAHDRRMREAQDQAAITDGQLAEQKTLGEENRSFVKSTLTMSQEITNSVKDDVADLQQGVEQLKVQQQENTDGINSNRDTLRAFTGYDLEAAIDSKVNQSFDNRLEPAMDELVERKYVLTAPTNGTDGYNPKIEEKGQFLAINEPDDAIDRAVKAGLKEGGRS
ncbi:hypothetical protein [Synechococcus sp. MIT S9504]|uniref:hypothetical protein n=1 Tax=Synechococcus sp. MIT S9504 TaxID=1801628 RepID=UPI0007BB13BD|nr:hypothetical protein [Synechococcus sp. MIT S9504]KZR80699.1 hypothetical protein MITS9504_03541 [Synechococcus sp. MIT S9504]